MKKTKFTEQKIAFALRQAETGTRVGGYLPQDGDLRGHVLQREEERYLN